MVVWSGWDDSIVSRDWPWLLKTVENFGVSKDSLDISITEMSSRLWSRVIITLDDALEVRMARVGMAMAALLMTRRVIGVAMKISFRIIFLLWAIGMVLWEVPPGTVADLFWYGIVRPLSVLTERGPSSFLEWVKWRLVFAFVEVSIATRAVESSVRRKVSAKLAGDSVTFFGPFQGICFAGS
jgi:hypothetical protein